MKRKITAIMLAIIMTVTLFPALPVYAATTITITPEGGNQSGTGWTWDDGKNTLTLSGNTDIPAGEITFSGEFGVGYIMINDTYTGATPTINFNNFSITGSAAGDPANGSAIFIPAKGGAHPIIFDFTGTNTIRGVNSSTTTGGMAIKKQSSGSLTINGAVDLIGGDSTNIVASYEGSGGFGIYNYLGDVTINATGPVNINSGDGCGGSIGYGIYAGEAVTINGSGAVNITTGDKTGNTTMFGGYGIYAKDVTLNNPNTIIHAGDCYASLSVAPNGIFAFNTVTINEAVTIIGGNGVENNPSKASPYGISCKGLIDIKGSGLVKITGGNSTGDVGNGGHGIFLYDTGRLSISNPNTIITGGNGSGSGTKLGFGGSAVYINNATYAMTLPYSNISNLVAGTGSTNGSKIFIGTDYFNQTSGKYNTLAEMKTNPTQIIFSGTETTAPDAPTEVMATPGDGEASVSFTAPSSNGGSSITSYTVTSSPDGKTATGAASPVLVTGLTNGTAYTFTVTATNIVGMGSSSEPSNAVTLVKPVTGITGVPTTGTVGTGLTLSGTVAPADSTNNTIVWSVKSGTATITGSAVTATVAGNVVVTATITNGLTASTDYTQDFAITFSDEYKAVTGITGVPTTGTVGTGLTLSGTVAPVDAKNNAIVWSVKSGTATITGSAVTATAAGNVVVTATITNGLTASTDYTQDFAITFSDEYKAVTSISGTPTTGTAGTEVDLTGATVNPADAKNKTIVWSVENAGTTGVTTANLATGKFTPAAAGTLLLTATITNGATVSTDYTQDVTISVNPSGTNIYTISADTASFNFGSLTIGYGSAPASQMVTIINTGNQTITLTEPATTNSSSNYTIGLLSDITLDASDTAAFTLQPKTGLVVGTYNETIQIEGTDSAATSVSVQFSVTSSSGSGSGGSTATTVINTNTGSITGNQLNNAAGVAKNGETVTINSNKTSEVTFPTSGLDALTGNNNSLTVVTDNGTLTFNSKAVAAMGTQAAATNIKVIVEDVLKTTLTGEQQTKVGDKNVYDLTVISGGKLISNFNGGSVYVSIPYELKEGETADNLTVWYMADDGSLTEIKCTYDTKTKSVTFVVDHFSKYIIGYDDLVGWVNPFTDVKSSAWYYNAVAFVNMNGLMNGQTDTTFGSEIAMTRSMFVTILGRMEGVDATMYINKNTFSDVKNDQYYTPYIAWASDKGIVSGVGGDNFAPNAAVTREQMAVVMTNYMKFKDQGPKDEWAIQLTYKDLDKVSSWADEGVMFMTMKDLMKGMGNDANGNPLFAPKSTSTRAQTAQVMMILEEILK